MAQADGNVASTQEYYLSQQHLSGKQIVLTRTESQRLKLDRRKESSNDH